MTFLYYTGTKALRPTWRTERFCNYDVSTLCWRWPTLPFASTIGSGRLNCRVRNENGCDPSAEAPTQNAQTFCLLNKRIASSKSKKEKNCIRDSHNSFQEFCRGISTPRLNTLLCFHLVPINVVISHGPQRIPYLRVGFPLRCFQRLSVPDIATGRCYWRNSPQTRGQFISVLSY